MMNTTSTLFCSRKILQYHRLVWNSIPLSSTFATKTSATTTLQDDNTKNANEMSTASADTETDVPLCTYLHVGPSGDVWLGDAIFAAKHLQPNYVKSLPLIPRESLQRNSHRLLELLEEHPEWAQQVYDTETLPGVVLRELEKQEAEEDEL